MCTGGEGVNQGKLEECSMISHSTKEEKERAASSSTATDVWRGLKRGGNLFANADLSFMSK